jgi:DNA invertase Pin-like site-specific DNA recombinase
MKARYIRVSTLNQKIERQLKKNHQGEIIYIDKVSGSIPFSKRPQAFKLLKDILDKKINYVNISSIDRLGRNTLDVLQTIEQLHLQNVCLKVDNLGLESLTNGKENPTFKLIISVLANISEMERNSILERQKEGITIAKAKGIYKGRIKNTAESTEKFLSKYPKVVNYLNKKTPPTIIEIAKLTDCSKNTVQKIKKTLHQTLNINA